MPINDHTVLWVVQVTESADRDVGEAVDYFLDIEEYDAADDFLNQFEAVKQRLEELPERGHVPEEFKKIDVLTYREVHFGKFRLIFHVEKALRSVFVDAVLHGKRNVERILKERLIRLPSDPGS